MAITTSIAPSYAWRMIFIAVLCAVFGLWGAYDYWVAIPRQEAIYAEYEAAKTEAARVEKLALSQPLSDQDRLAFDQATATVNRLAPTGAAPVRPGKWDRLTQWFFISCLPFTFYGIWLYKKAKRQVFRLDEQGTLHFAGDAALGSGAWTQAEIADIDMSRWMAKSIAYAVHAD